jgi:Flp pilus assembly protein TadG
MSPQHGRSPLRRLVDIAGRFARDLGGDRRGAIAVQAALCAGPILVMTFGALDIANASQEKTRLQDALDAAALAAARSSATTDAQLYAVGSPTLTADLTGSKAIVTSSSFHAVDSKVVASATAKVPAMIAGIWSSGDMIVGAKSEVSRAVTKVELSLVLDNTGSMAGTKLANLKTAAKSLIDILSDAASRAAEPHSVKIAIAPFSMTVRVGSTYSSAAWIDQNAASPINDEIFASHANRFTLFSGMGVSWAGCVESRQYPYDVQDTAPSTGTPATLFTPFFAPDEPDNSNSGYVNNYLADVTGSSNWKTKQGYVAKYVTAPKSGTNGAGYTFGPNAGCTLASISRLSEDWTALKAKVDTMTAVGDTNIGMGLVWGWHLISPNAPFADGSAYGTPKLQKIVVLMTDGENTNGDTSSNDDSVYAGVGYIWQNRLGLTSGTATQRRSAMDGRLATLCANMKAQGIILYTVRVEVSNGTSTVLQNCASTSDKFYDVQNASQLTAVFDAIAGSIQNLRIMK